MDKSVVSKASAGICQSAAGAVRAWPSCPGYFTHPVPEAFYFYTHGDWERFRGSATWSTTTIATAYGSMTQAYVFGDGYRTVGWTPTKGIEAWLTEHTLSFLARHYPSDYAHAIGSEPRDEDGSICRLPTADEARL